MSNTIRWKYIMDCYYTGLSTDFLKSDLATAGFIVEQDETTINNVNVGSIEIEVSFREVATSNETEVIGEPLPLPKTQTAN
ncbi:hypothetical protein PALU110988_21915 [Paenibacillus lupini]|nr:hypothetical protein [Paenibacillus lupini]